jgi:hypothetical protein
LLIKTKRSPFCKFLSSNNLHVEVFSPDSIFADSSGPGGNGIGIASAFYNSYWTGFVGSLDDVMLYTDVLASEKINEIYAKGLISHGLAVR